MAVRTKTLAAASATPTLQAVYTCPAGETAIVKSVVIGKFGTGAVLVTVTVLRGATAYGLGRFQTALAASVIEHQGWWVLMPGDVLRLQTDTGTATAWISGTELEGVAD